MNLRTLNKVRRRAYRLARRKFFAGTARWVFGDVPLERRLLTYKCTYPGMPKRIYSVISMPVRVPTSVRNVVSSLR